MQSGGVDGVGGWGEAARRWTSVGGVRGGARALLIL